MFFCLLLGHREFNILRPKEDRNLFSKSRVITQIFQDTREHAEGQACSRVSRHVDCDFSSTEEGRIPLLLLLCELFLGLIPSQDLAVAVAHHLEVLEHTGASDLIRLTEGKAHTVNRSLDGSVNHLC